MKRADRIKLMNEIRTTIGLPILGEIQQYFTRRELLELLTFIKLKAGTDEKKDDSRSL